MLFCTVRFVSGYEIDPVTRSNNTAVVNRIFKENQEKYKNNPDMLLLPGLLADRKTKRIILQAEATGMTEGSPIEFFLIGEKSGHGYESLSVSFAQPSDVQKALEFLEMQAGRPTDARKCYFWPKGERVIMTFASMDAEKSLRPIRAEKLVLDSRTKKTLPEYGLVFTGSIMLESTNIPGKKIYAVDAKEPNSIASTYNALETVMDVPFAWSQKSAYGNILINPAHILKAGCLLEITIEPEYKDGKKRVLDLKLEVTTKPDTDIKTLDDLEYHLKDSDNMELNKKLSLNSVLKVFDSINDKGQDPFVSLNISDDITITAVAKLCAICSTIDTEKGIRIEPPASGHLYYRAFIPNEQQRNRAERFAQPWEFSLSLINSGMAGVLTKIDQLWKKDKIDPDLKATDFVVNTPQDLQKELKEKGPGIPVIFVFADPLITYGQLMSFIRPVLESYPMIHVFVK